MPHQLTKLIIFTTNLSQPDQDQSFLFNALNLPRILCQIKHIKVILPFFFIFGVIKHLAALFGITFFYTTVHTILFILTHRHSVHMLAARDITFAICTPQLRIQRWKK